MRKIASAKVDLPEPDSPASPNRSPVARAKLTLSTACTKPCGVVEADAQALNLQNQFAHLLLRWLGRQLEESLLHGGH
jgi:hypothetical protein